MKAYYGRKYAGLAYFRLGISLGKYRLLRAPFDGGRFSETANSEGATLRTGCGELRSRSEQIIPLSCSKRSFEYGGPFAFVLFSCCLDWLFAFALLIVVVPWLRFFTSPPLLLSFVVVDICCCLSLLMSYGCGPRVTLVTWLGETRSKDKAYLGEGAKVPTRLLNHTQGLKFMGRF